MPRNGERCLQVKSLEVIPLPDELSRYGPGWLERPSEAAVLPKR